jgi:mannose-6-phosphate isomerase-like protein (cupin superfamily)
MTMHATPGTEPVSSGDRPPERWSRTADGEGRAYWFFDALAVIRTPASTSPAVIEMTVSPGGGAPLHVHPSLDDSFYLLDGQLAMRCGEHTFLARPGDYVVLPRGVPHTFRVLGSQPARMLQVHQDDSFLRFIQATGIPADTPTLPASTQLSIPFEDMPRIAAETGQPVIGPPMSEQEALQIARAAAAS